MLLMEETRKVEFWEDSLLIKTLSDKEELRESFRLRHQVFADRLRWVPRSEDELEMDSYDAYATSVGLFDGNHHLRGVFRMVNSSYPFMLESEFRACLLPQCEIRKAPDTVEITRLAIDPTLTEKGLSNRLMQVLFKGVYQWSMQNEVRYLYMVVEKRFLRVLRGMGFTCEAVSPAVALPPAETLSIAAVLDWEQFHATCPVKQPAFYHWINSVDGSASFERSAFMARDSKEENNGVKVYQDGRGAQTTAADLEQALIAA